MHIQNRKFIFTFVLVNFLIIMFPQEFKCFDGIDNDNDGLTDLDDESDCGCYLFNAVGSSILEIDPPLDEYDGNYCFEITSNSTNRTGAIWLRNKVNLSQPFNFNAVIYAGDKDSNGADGFTITLQNQNENALGVQGGGLAYRGIAPSIAFEIDTWYNSVTSDGNDTQTTTDDHVNVTINGDQSNFVGTPQFINLDNIEDNSYRNVVIEWNPESQLLTFQIEGQQPITYQEDIVNNIFNGQSQVWFGFTGSTGLSFNRQVVCILESETFQFPYAGEDNNIEICNYDSVFNLYDSLGSSEGNPDADGSWFFNNTPFGLGNNVNFNPSVNTTGTYTYVVPNNQTNCADAKATLEIIVKEVETTQISNLN